MGLECCIGIFGFGMHGILVCKSEGRLVYRDYNREISTRYEYIPNWYANQLCGMQCSYRYAYYASMVVCKKKKRGEGLSVYLVSVCLVCLLMGRLVFRDR